MSKQINPYLDFVLGLDATQFDSLCDAINQRKDRERYGATSFEEAALNYGRKRFVQSVYQISIMKMATLHHWQSGISVKTVNAVIHYCLIPYLILQKYHSTS